MFKTSIQFNDYVSLAVMLLMAVALIAGQADANGEMAGRVNSTPMPILADEALDAMRNVRLSGYLDDKALKVSIDIVTDLGQFRGEDE